MENIGVITQKPSTTKKQLIEDKGSLQKTNAKINKEAHKGLGSENEKRAMLLNNKYIELVKK